MPETKQYPEFDRIVDQVLKGERVFVFWPGTGMMVTIIMLHLFAIAAWLAPTFFGFLPRIQQVFPDWPMFMLAALAICSQTLIIPAFMVIGGWPRGFDLLVAMTRLLFIGAALTLLFSAVGLFDAPAWPYLACCALLASAHVLERSESARIYAVLRQRFRVRRAERAEEIQAVIRKRTGA